MYRIFLSFLFLFLLQTGFAFSQCIVSDGGDTGAVGQLRDCLDNTAMDIQVNVNVTLNGILVIFRDVEIFGNGAPGTGPTVEQGMVPQRLFVILDGITPLNVVIRNLTLTGSFTNVDGGLISNDDNNVTVESSNLIDMASDSSGGAIW